LWPFDNFAHVDCGNAAPNAPCVIGSILFQD
jgi:hypothetical protein